MFSAGAESLGMFTVVPISTLSTASTCKQRYCQRLTCQSSNAANTVISAPSRSLQLNVHTEGSLSLNNINHIAAPAKKALGDNYIDYHPSKLDVIVDVLRGRLLSGGLVYQQNFLIKSYELGPDGKVTMGAILNQLQESAINHFKSCGLAAEGFGSTSEMTKRNLIWVVYKLQVEVDRYPSWADVVQVNTWTYASGKNGMGRDWVVRDSKTGEVLVRAVSLYVIMNKETRRLSKFIDEIRAEINPHFMEACDPIIKEDDTKIQKLDAASADCVRTGLLPGWTDLDLNQHVNHVKYINWIVESAPRSVLESQRLSALTLQYRKECGTDSALQALSAVVQNHEADQSDERQIELHHSLRLENGSELVRGRTLWRPRPKNIRNGPFESPDSAIA